MEQKIIIIRYLYDLVEKLASGPRIANKLHHSTNNALFKMSWSDYSSIILRMPRGYPAGTNSLNVTIISYVKTSHQYQLGRRSPEDFRQRGVALRQLPPAAHR